MKTLTIKEILSVTNGELLCGSADTKICSVTANSKIIGNNALFVPLKGEKFDAHDFICDALDNDAVATFTQKKELCNGKKIWIYVKNSLQALQNLASYYRDKLKLPIIGITGSVGKTTTKEMIACALSSKLKVFKTPGNDNSQIGTPLAVLNIDDSYDVAVIEMGMSLFGEMERLAQVVKPTHAVITNIGLSHIGNLKTQDNILKEKFHITDFIPDKKNVFVNGDDKLLKNLKNKYPSCKTFGLSPTNDYFADNIKSSSDLTSFIVHSNTKLSISGEYEIPVPGMHNIANAIISVVLGKELKIDESDIKSNLKNYKNLPMRQNIIHRKGITVIDDSYNASPDSVKSSLSVLESLDTSGKKIAILADMLELGELSAEIHFNLGKEIAKNYNIDMLIVFGKDALEIGKGAEYSNCKFKVQYFSDKEKLINNIKKIIEKNDMILVKGSRGLKMDEVVSQITV